MYLARLEDDPSTPFPPLETARVEPNGLLACGGDLSTTRLMNAYRHGIFPWYAKGDPILWWSPDPRAVFDTSALHLSRRLRRQWRHCNWTIQIDRDFADVVSGCAHTPRRGRHGTWILPEMQTAYQALYHLGHAHCVSVCANDRLIGGIYGVLAGPVFCGESMYGSESGASTLALAALCRLLGQHGVTWLDAQMHTPHLARLGARMISRVEYQHRLAADPSPSLPAASWARLVDSWSARDFSDAEAVPSRPPHRS